MERYDFTTHWTFEAPVSAVWAELEDANSWHRWTPGFRRVQLRDGADRLRPGVRADCEIRSALPHTLRFWFEVDEYRSERLIGIVADGDVRGTGRWELRPVPHGTEVTYRWNVGLTRPLLDALGRLPAAKRLLAWNHDHVMARARDGLERRVAARVADGAR